MLWRLSTKFLGLLVRTTNAPLARVVWFACFGRSRLLFLGDLSVRVSIGNMGTWLACRVVKMQVFRYAQDAILFDT